ASQVFLESLSIRRLPFRACRAKATCATRGCIKCFHFVKLCLCDRRNDHLGNPRSTLDDETFLPEIDEDHFHFAAIVAIDRTRRIENRDAVLRSKARARAHLRLIALRQRNGEAGRHHRAFTEGKRERFAFRQRGDQVHAGSAFRLIARQRQAFAMRQALHANINLGSHALVSLLEKCSAIRRARRSATACLGRSGQSSWPAPVMRCTVLRSPPITPVAGETSFATIQSQRLRARFDCACSITFSVSAAKPTTSGGRLF